MKKLTAVRFSRQHEQDFVSTLKLRVKSYFDSENISHYGNWSMFTKTIVMLSIYFIPYFLMLFAPITNPWLFVTLWIGMGMGMAGIGLSVMHDANHGSYSKNKKVNDLVSYVMHLVGGSANNWRIQHNILHHTYTNIEGMDEDITTVPILRFSPHQKYYWIHRFQYIYAWFLYGLMTLMWSLSKDYKQLYRYHKMDLLKTQKKSFRFRLIELILSKILYYAYVIVVPLLVTPFAWYWILIGFLFMHLTAGFILSIIFQPAHVMPTSDFPLPDDKGNIENNFAIHQMLTTTNFSPKSRVFSWFVGGLNYQVEHHLFPNICHVHYKRISKIVKETADEFKIPYHTQRNFMLALWNHAKMLKMLGRKEYAFVKANV